MTSNEKLRDLIRPEVRTVKRAIVLALVLVLPALMMTSAQAAPSWRTAAVYKSSAANWPAGYTGTDIRFPNRIRFKVTTSLQNQRVEFSWDVICVSGSGNIATRSNSGTWNTGSNKTRIFEPNLPFTNVNRNECSASLSTFVDGNAKFATGRIQFVKRS